MRLFLLKLCDLRLQFGRLGARIPNLIGCFVNFFEVTLQFLQCLGELSDKILIEKLGWDLNGHKIFGKVGTLLQVLQSL